MRRGLVTVGVLGLAAVGVALAVRARPPSLPAAAGTPRPAWAGDLLPAGGAPAALPGVEEARPRVVLPPDPPEHRRVGCGGYVDEDGDEILVKCGRG